jgi:hypothetical protein
MTKYFYARSVAAWKPSTGAIQFDTNVMMMVVVVMMMMMMVMMVMMVMMMVVMVVVMMMMMMITVAVNGVFLPGQLLGHRIRIQHSVAPLAL